MNVSLARDLTRFQVYSRPTYLEGKPDRECSMPVYSMAALIAKGECIAGEKDRHKDEAYTG